MLSPLYGQLSPLRVPTKAVFDPAPIINAYISAVEAADGQSLEQGVKDAYSDFITGCVNDGIWPAIKAACILAGARTLDGALVPIVGSAPTNNNFVSGDYNRKIGLKGNSSTKYLNSNRPGNSDPQNNAHISSYQSEIPSPRGSMVSYYKSTSPSLLSEIYVSSTTFIPRLNNGTTTITNQTGGNNLGLFCASRQNSSNYQIKSGTGSIITLNINSASPEALNFYIFARNTDNTPSLNHSGRLSYYSIGESLDLALLDTRVSTLMTDLAAAIP
jgi:hypothetical protein